MSSAWGAANSQNSVPLRTLFDRAQDDLRQNHLPEAARGFEEVIRADPNLAEAHASLGVVRYTQAKYPEALLSFRQALRLKPSLGNAACFVGLIQAKLGREQEALPLLHKAFEGLASEELRLQAGLMLIQLYHSSQESSKALPILLALEGAYPTNPEVSYAGYRIYSDLGAKAISTLIRSGPETGRIHQVTAELMETAGDFPRALEQYRRALELDPTLPGIHRALGVAILNVAQDQAARAQARQLFESELALNPADSYSEYQLGEIHFVESRFEQALAHFNRAAELRPDFVDAMIALGKLWTVRGEPERAVSYLQNALRNDPDNEVAHYRLALAYGRLGRNRESEEELAAFRRLRGATASIASIYRQVLKKPVISQTLSSIEVSQ
jgi:tetratricopeptide (TPR) repeat protein